MSNEHICTVCNRPSEAHPEDGHWPPPCCEGCDCSSAPTADQQGECKHLPLIDAVCPCGQSVHDIFDSFRARITFLEAELEEARNLLGSLAGFVTGVRDEEPLWERQSVRLLNEYRAFLSRLSSTGGED